MNADWETGGRNILLFFVAMSLGLSLSYPSDGTTESETGVRTHHRNSIKHNYTHHSTNSTKHRHKHNNNDNDNSNNGKKHIDDENGDEQDLRHHVIEPPRSMFENFTEGYPADSSYGYWPEQDEFPWYVFLFTLFSPHFEHAS